MKKKTLGKILVVTCIALGLISIQAVTAYCEARISGGTSTPDTGSRTMPAVNRIKQMGSYISILRPDGTVILGREAVEAEYNRLVALGSTATPEENQLREEIGRRLKSWLSDNSTRAGRGQVVISSNVMDDLVNQLGSYKKETQPSSVSFTVYSRNGESLNVTVQLGPTKDNQDTLIIIIDGNTFFEGTKAELESALSHGGNISMFQMAEQQVLGRWDDLLSQLGSYKKETQPSSLSFTRMGLGVTVQLGPKKDGKDTLKITIGNHTFEGTQDELSQLFNYTDDGSHHPVDPAPEQLVLQGLLGQWDDLVNQLTNPASVRKNR